MVTSFFALLGFIAVPIGDRTAYEHVKVALLTPEGREAARALSHAYSALREKLVGWAVEKLGETSVVRLGDPPARLDPKQLVPHERTRRKSASDGEQP